MLTPNIGGTESEVTYMADTLIKGFRIPENCSVCPVKHRADYGLYTCPFVSGYAFAGVTDRSDLCPLVDLGTHGPLIDISKAEVVIPASKEEER